MRLSVELDAPESFPGAYNPENTAVADSPTGTNIEPLNAAIAADTQTSADDVPAIEGIAPDVNEFRTIVWQFEPAASCLIRSVFAAFRVYRSKRILWRCRPRVLSQQETLVEDAPGNDETSVDRMTLEALLFPPH